jgi:hypothetical protein
MFSVVAAGCGSAPRVPEAAAPARQVVVELLDADFVRYQGDRLPMDDFFYEVRLLCRQAFDQGATAPSIEVHVSPDAVGVDSTTFERLQRGMWDAGVGSIEPK